MTTFWSVLSQSLSQAMLFAQGAAAPAPAGQPAPDMWSGLQQMMPMVLMLMALFFFVVLRPQQREQRAREALLKAIKKNDRVVTTGGIFGVVTNVQIDVGEVTIRVDEKTDAKLRVTLSSIARVLDDASATEEKSEKNS